MNFIREVKFIGGYDWGPDYGIHGMNIYFSVKGDKGTITITIYTSWALPQNQEANKHLLCYPFDPIDLFRPIVDVDYHSKTSQYDGQVCRNNCEFIDGPCYDGSSLWGNEAWRDGFLHGGSDWLFARMEDEYRNRFENGPPVDLTPIPRPFPQKATQ